MPKKVEQINDHLYIDTYKSNNIKICVNDMMVKDSECMWDEQPEVVEMDDYSIKQEQNDRKIYYYFKTRGEKGDWVIRVEDRVQWCKGNERREQW